MIYIPLYDNFKHLYIVGGGLDRTESNQINPNKPKPNKSKPNKPKPNKPKPNKPY